MTMDETISAADAMRITAYLDIEARPTMPTVHVIFGANQATPAEMVARRYHQGLAPFHHPYRWSEPTHRRVGSDAQGMAGDPRAAGGRIAPGS